MRGLFPPPPWLRRRASFSSRWNMMKQVGECREQLEQGRELQRSAERLACPGRGSCCLWLALSPVVRAVAVRREPRWEGKGRPRI